MRRSSLRPTTDIDALAGVPRTMLWTLHCRASSAELGDLEDPEGVAIRRALGSHLDGFGRPDRAFAVRARLFDQKLESYLQRYPGTTVVSLGEGLETQRSRVAGYGRWLSIDLPEVISIRERFLPAGPLHENRAGSALNLDWISDVDLGGFVVAQGLFMYLPPESVSDILHTWSRRAEGELMFDVVPPWVSRLSRMRVPMSSGFRLPPMAWGGRLDKVRALVEGAVKEPYALEFIDCPLPAGPLPWAGRTVVAHIRRGALRPDQASQEPIATRPRPVRAASRTHARGRPVRA